VSNSIASILSSSVSGVAPALSGLGGVVHVISRLASQALGATGSAGVQMDPQYAALMQEQMRFQEQMQIVSMKSNELKSEHETAMSVIRNARVG
jgi:hypothetical protein